MSSNHAAFLQISSYASSITLCIQITVVSQLILKPDFFISTHHWVSFCSSGTSHTWIFSPSLSLLRKSSKLDLHMSHAFVSSILLKSTFHKFIHSTQPLVMIFIFHSLTIPEGSIWRSNSFSHTITVCQALCHHWNLTMTSLYWASISVIFPFHVSHHWFQHTIEVLISLCLSSICDHFIQFPISICVKKYMLYL